MKNRIKVGIIRFCWWIFPPLGTTVNELFGGRKITKISGGYEQRKPNLDK